CWRYRVCRSQCSHPCTWSSSLRRHLKVEIFQASCAWMNFCRKYILARQQCINFCRTIAWRIYDQDALIMAILLDVRAGNPVSSLCLRLLNEAQGIMYLFVTAHAYLYLLRRGQQFCNISLFKQIAFFQYCHAITHLLHFIKYMTGEKDSLAQRRKTLDQTTYFDNASRIKPICRFVQHYQFR